MLRQPIKASNAYPTKLNGNKHAGETLRSEIQNMQVFDCLLSNDFDDITGTARFDRTTDTK